MNEAIKLQNLYTGIASFVEYPKKNTNNEKSIPDPETPIKLVKILDPKFKKNPMPINKLKFSLIYKSIFGLVCEGSSSVLCCSIVEAIF